MRTKVDIALVREGCLNLQGWAFGKDPETEVSFRVTDEKGTEIPGTTYGTVRRDAVVEAYFADYVKTHGAIRRELGFDINVPYTPGRTCFLVMQADGRTRRVKFDDTIIERFNSHARRKREKLLALFNMETLEAVRDTLREGGVRVLFRKTVNKLKGIQEDFDYNEWYKLTCTTEEELAAQREQQAAPAEQIRPLFSIVIPAYRTPERFLRRMLQSIEEQTFRDFQVCVADATPYEDEGFVWMDRDGKLPKDVLAEYAARDPRFQYQILKRNLGISDNTNAAINMSSDHDDELAPDALYECAAAILAHPEACVLYTDEDKIDFESAYRFEPHFKSDYNPDMLRSVNYICHMFVAARDLLDSIAEENPDGTRRYERREYDGAQDYDLILRACEAAEQRERAADAHSDGSSYRSLRAQGLYTSRTILHIRKALYHWRSHQMSTAANPEAKLYAFEAGARAVRDHCLRKGLPVTKVEKGITYGYYHPYYANENPLVSVIIPNKDHAEDVDKAIRSLITKGSYRNLEFIVVENNSTDEKTFAYYEAVQKEFPSVHVVYWPREFNYSAINNFGVQHAEGEYLLFMNNDIELIAPDSVSEMLGYVEREDVGVCGARLLYPDEQIQHAGVVVGFGGIAGAAFIGIHDKELTYMHRAKCIQDYSAVTAACMLSKRSVFDAVGGFTEALAVAFNDIDYCMKVRALGKLVVYNPYAEFYHYESKSRGLEDTPEKVARFNSEIVTFARRWPEILRAGDPYYHPALTLRKSNFVLRDLTKEKPGEPFGLDILKGIV